MNIWIINHYAVPTKYYPLARPASFAKYLLKMGHEVTIFSASTVHNSDINLINDGSLYKEEYVDGIHYVYVKDRGYSGNGVSRIINMILFPIRLPKVCKQFKQPDAILSVSITPMACMKGIKLAKKYGCKCVAEIADLWPESIVAYGIASKNNPIIKLLYLYEKRLYTKAEQIIFTMEGGRDYIIEKGWDNEHGGSIDLKKVHHINNGVDLEVFDYNKMHYSVEDDDLNNEKLFKVVYTGSVRKVNDLNQLVDVAKILQDQGVNDIKLLIYGDGDKREELQNECKKLNLNNIVFKGKVMKEQVAFILSKADLCLLHWQPTPITKYGMSMNKLFEYFAAGKPILSNSVVGYDLIQKYNCGVSINFQDANEYADTIKKMRDLSINEGSHYSINSRKTATEYDFKTLTNRLVGILND